MLWIQERECHASDAPLSTFRPAPSPQEKAAGQRPKLTAAMRTPPALAHPAGRASWLAALLLALWLPALLATLAATFSGSARSGAWLGVPWLALALIGGGLWRFWRQQTPRELAFDGQGWLLREPGRPDQAVSRVQVALDGQRFLLLRLERAGAPPLWLCLRRGAGSAAAAAWRLLRCALYSPAPGSACSCARR